MPIYKMDGKKDGLQKYHVRVNYISDGGEAKQLTRVAYGLEAAKSLESSLTGEMKSQGAGAVRRVTLEELFEQYLKVKQYEVRATTTDKRRRDFAYYILPTLGV